MRREVEFSDVYGQQPRLRAGDRLISEVAARQHGVVSNAQLRALGLGDRGIQHRVARGRLHRLHRGVYAVGHTVLTRNGRWLAAVLAGGEGAVLSHRSAAALWDLSTSTLTDVTVAVKRASRDGLHFHSASLEPADVTVLAAIPVTTVARTLLDLSAVARTDQLARAVREAEYLRLFDLREISTLLARYRGRRGTAALKKAIARLAATEGITRNDFEEAFLGRLSQHGLPMPELNAWVQVGDRWREVDFFWRDERLFVELDGYAGHGTRSAYEADRARDRAAQAAGFKVIRITWRQFVDDWQGIERDLRALLTTND
jgi:very-short-patch-repair endonuclease/predicted transcriptional regulator of viral defense system